MEKQTKHKNKYYTCKRLRLLEYLQSKGFTHCETRIDVTNPRFKVWRFENTPELEAALEKYFERFKE